jgi:hypothetical protein
MAIPGAFGTFTNGFHLLLARSSTTDDARSFRRCRRATVLDDDGANARLVDDVNDDIFRRRELGSGASHTEDQMTECLLT